MMDYNPNYIFVSGTSLTNLQNLATATSHLSLNQPEIKEDYSANIVKQPRNYQLATTLRYWMEIPLINKGMTDKQYIQLLTTLRLEHPDLIIAPYYSYPGVEKIGLSNYLLVKLKETEDFSRLLETTAPYNLELVGYNEFLPKWITFSVKQGGLDALTIANLLYETDLFDQVEPDLMSDRRLFSPEDNSTNMEDLTPNDPLFTSQWSLKNTGQNGGTAGIDINAEDAWDIETGKSSVRIAVVDEGFQRNHPDLSPNNHGNGYNTQTGGSPASEYGGHGTACAGIIAARGNNGIGVSGVAPTTRMMSVSHDFDGPNSSQRLANGISWSTSNGASVISNSWGGGSVSGAINSAISNALNNGRGGLGCVVVFASGNDNSSVSFPANGNSGVLAVGAMSPCGERKNPSSCDGATNWGSNYGNQLDVIAPGVIMPTTRMNSTYMSGFSGTSSACPVVAGVAALVISVDPTLTVAEVRNIIESTAQKVRPDLYNYINKASRPNGTWNSKTGYGLVDAHAAVLEALNCSVNLTLSGSESGNKTFLAANNITSTQTITPSADVTYSAGNLVILKPNFIAQNGTDFVATIGGCGAGTSTPPPPPIPLVSLPDEPYVYYYETPVAMRLPNQPSGTTLSVQPNPFNQTTVIRYQIEQSGHADLSVYDLKGRLIQQIVNGPVDQGGFQLEFDASDLNPGVYLARLIIGENVYTAKMILAK